MPGAGPWSAVYMAMRPLRDPDLFLEGDVVVRKTMAALGSPVRARGASDHAFAWRPWRSYAVMHLWRHAATAAGTQPAKEEQR